MTNGKRKRNELWKKLYGWRKPSHGRYERLGRPQVKAK